jgi:ABC-type glycerol-3-phosphate transport system substrate-binding protein
MQQPVCPIPQNRSKLSKLGAPAALLLLLGLLLGLGASAGCDGGTGTTAPGAIKKPHEGVRLTVSCPDPAFADAITPIANTWCARTGASVTVAPAPMTPTDATDIGVIPSGALGKWGEEGLLAPVPSKLLTSEQYQWQGLLPIYAERLSEWGGQTLAVPLTGDGYVIVYRAERLKEKTVADEFAKQYGRPPGAPATWEEFADLAEFFAQRDKRSSLPPLPADPAQLFDLLSRVAASADRRALNDAELAARTASDRDALAFQFSVVTGKPRIQNEGFQIAARWLDRLRTRALFAAAPGASDDPIAALVEGRATLALVSLDQLSRLPRENGAVPARFALASVPGTRTFHDPERPKEIAQQLNYVPYFSGGRLGVVRTRCPNPDAAFELLTELGGPAHSSELVGTPGLGAGPLRGAHLERDRLVLWLGYGFDEDRTRLLQDAMRQYIGQTVKNPTLGPRGPDRADLVAAAAEPLRKLTTGAVPPAEALKQIDAAWNALDAKVPPNVLLRWRQRGAGLQ